MKIFTLIKQNLQFSWLLGTFLTHLRKPPRLKPLWLWPCLNMSHNPLSPFLEKEEYMVFFQQQRLCLGKMCHHWLSILDILWGDVGGTRIYRELKKKKCHKIYCDRFKEVPVTGQKWNDNTGRQDRNTTTLQISLFLLSLSLLLSWNVPSMESVMLAEWKVSGTPKQKPSNSLQFLKKRQLQPLFPGKCQSWRQRSLWKWVGVCQSFKG